MKPVAMRSGAPGSTNSSRPASSHQQLQTIAMLLFGDNLPFFVLEPSNLFMFHRPFYDCYVFTPSTAHNLSGLTLFRPDSADCKPYGVSPPKTMVRLKKSLSYFEQINLVCQVWWLRIFWKKPLLLRECEKAGALYSNIVIPVGGYTPCLIQPLIPTVLQRSVYIYCGDYVILGKNWHTDRASNHVNLGRISMNFRPKAMVAPNKNKKV